jgi:hypothetical protein
MLTDETRAAIEEKIAVYENSLREVERNASAHAGAIQALRELLEMDKPDQSDGNGSNPVAVS